MWINNYINLLIYLLFGNGQLNLFIYLIIYLFLKNINIIQKKKRSIYVKMYNK